VRFLIRPSSFVILFLLLGAFLRFHQLGVVPPGLHYDFAANAIFANEIAFNNWREVFITAYTGKEVLFFYSAGLLFKFIGSSIFTLQLTAAIYGLLGIAATYFAARQMFADDRDAAWVAAFAASILAFSFMHLVWSRYGERVTTQPFVQAMAIGFLFRAFNRENRKGAQDAKDFDHVIPSVARNLIDSPRDSSSRFALLGMTLNFDFVLSGIFTGLAAYTYLSARLFPIPIAFALINFMIQQLAINRQPSHSASLRGLSSAKSKLQLLITNYSLFFIFALIIFAPLGYFFFQHPETFFVRYNQVIVQGDESDLLWRGITGALGMIFISGEPYDRFNIPLKPIFDPVVGFFFVVGLVKVIGDQLAVISRKRSAISNPQSLIPNLFLLIYTLTFLLPTALSVHDIFPSNVRAMGVMAVLTIFPALGIVAIGNWVISKWRIPKQTFFAASLFIVHSSLFIVTYTDYFNLWSKSPSLHYANDTDLVNASRWLNAQDTRDTDIYFSAIHYRHPTVAYLARDYANIRWYFGANALAIPEGKSLYVFPHSEPMIPEWIEKWNPVYAPTSPDGTPDFRAYKFDSTPPLLNFDSASANFGNIVEITGMRTAAPNAVDLKLRVLNPPDRADYRLVADLVDGRGFRWTQTYNDSYPSEQWQVGETILMRLKFEDQIGRPKGNYKIFLSFYSPNGKSSLSVVTPSGTAAYAILHQVPISNLQPSISKIVQPLVTLNSLNVIKLDAPPATLRQGEPLPFTIYWQAPQELINAVIRIKLNDRELETRTITRLATGEMLIDRYAPRIPRNLAAGAYPVTVNDFLIGTVTVKEVERRMTAPAPTVISNKVISDQVELVGYDLKNDSITLHWRALKETDVDYTLFVHVLDANGQIVAQNDSQPRGGSYPTSMWVKGEYVSDTIALAASAGKGIEVGWYILETGERVGEAVKITP